MKKEIWKDIPGYIGLYQVSNWGNVKSLLRGGRILKNDISICGYYRVTLYLNNKSKHMKVHKLVAMAFLGHIPNGHNEVVNHIDNNPLNNNLNNLEIVSQRYNASCHKIDAGVSWHAKNSKWVVHIHINKKVYLGLFINKQDAIDMYQKALANIHLYNGDAKAFRLVLAT
jgi:hypothetical protein